MTIKRFLYGFLFCVLSGVGCSEDATSSAGESATSGATASTNNGTEGTSTTGADPAATTVSSNTAIPPGDVGVDDSGDGGDESDAQAQDVGAEGDAGTEDTEGDVNSCVSINVRAEELLLPVDIIWVIDASPSMQEEIAIIEANLNRFADRIGATDLDYRVVLVGSDQEYCSDGQCFLEICVPPPLSGAAGCPDTDSARYRHVREGVHSRDGLNKLLAQSDAFLDFLRPEALTHFIMVTDDDAGFGADADDFEAFIGQQAPRFTAGWKFHSVVDLIGYDPGCVFDEALCSCGENRGQTYITLSERSGGLIESVCQEDWTSVFDELETRVREGTEVPCAFELPTPEDGSRLDPDAVNVVFLSSDRTARQVIPQVAGEQDCALGRGWYYDDPDVPSTLFLCPEICASDADIIEIEIGCVTVKY